MPLHQCRVPFYTIIFMYLYTVGLLSPHTRASSDTFILALVYITFRQYTNHNPNRIGHYVKLFPAFNFGFLFPLTGMMMLTGMR